MAKTINLNADIAEGWGAYDIGNDVELIKIIKSANVACGFHAGDPNTMHRLCMLAKQEDVSIGVHPGFNDLWGFGRRRIDMKPRDLEYMVAYQIGALQAMASYAGLPVTHLKPHGALNNMAAENEDYAMAIGRAIKTVDRNIIYVALFGSQMQKAAEKLGLPLAREGFVDRKYDDDANLASRSIPGTVLKDPQDAIENTLRMVQEGVVISMSGKRVKVEADTYCVHGDEATGVKIAGAVRKALEAAGIKVAKLTDMKL
jgi:UPF0271 protein